MNKVVYLFDFVIFVSTLFSDFMGLEVYPWPNVTDSELYSIPKPKSLLFPIDQKIKGIFCIIWKGKDKTHFRYITDF